MICRRDTSESDLSCLGIGPYADTLCRLDGGIDHIQLNISAKNFQLKDSKQYINLAYNGSSE